MITQSEEPAAEKIEVHKHRSYLYCLSAVTGETGLTGGTKAIITPEKRIPKKKKYKIPSFVSTKKGSNSKLG